MRTKMIIGGVILAILMAAYLTRYKFFVRPWGYVIRYNRWTGKADYVIPEEPKGEPKPRPIKYNLYQSEPRNFESRFLKL